MYVEDCTDNAMSVFLLLLHLHIKEALQAQIMDEAVYISHSANTIGKGIIPTIIPLAMVK